MPFSKKITREPAPANPNRRSVLKGGAALGMATAAGLWMPAAAAAAAEPRRGGHAIFAIGKASTSDNLDPRIVHADFMTITRVTLHDTLFEITSTGDIIPSIAESAEANDDATVWRVAIKPGVTFHNGQAVTVEDVVNSINLHIAEGSISHLKTVMSHLDRIEADGNTVIFHLTEGDADWTANLAEYALSILPTKDGASDWQSGIGCGPYRLVQLEPGVRVRVEKFENDHRSDRGWFDSVEMVAVNDASARVNSIMSGEAHAISEVSPIVANRLARAPGVNVLSRTSPGYCAFDAQMTMSPMDDRNVRLALKYAIDREEFVEKILAGHGTVANDQPIGPTYRYHAEIEQHSYDPDRARFHLKEAGLDGLNIKLSTSEAAFAGAVDAAQLYSESSRAAGINMSVGREPADGFWTNVWGKVPFCASFWTGRPTEALIISLAYGSDASWNLSGFTSATLDRLVAQARAEQDEAKRAELFAEAQRLLNKDGPSVMPAFYNVVDAVSDQIGVTETDVSTAPLDSRYAVSRWWFK